MTDAAEDWLSIYRYSLACWGIDEAQLKSKARFIAMGDGRTEITRNDLESALARSSTIDK